MQYDIIQCRKGSFASEKVKLNISIYIEEIHLDTQDEGFWEFARMDFKEELGATSLPSQLYAFLCMLCHEH